MNRLPPIDQGISRVLKPPVATPLMAVIIHRVLKRVGGALDLARGWPSCAGWCPADERMAETSPVEWLRKLPASVQSQIKDSLNSRLFRQSISPAPTSGLPPILISSALAGSSKQAIDFSSCSPPSAFVAARGRVWAQDPAETSAWIIEARKDSDAWIEMECGQEWDPVIARICLRLGAGIWLHSPSKKLGNPDKCPTLTGAFDAMITTPGWDQWVWPLADALEFAILERLDPSRAGLWDPEGAKRASRWSGLPDWAWHRANTTYDGSFGCLCMALSSHLSATIGLPVASPVV
jgi:hypothetical protein